MMAQGERACVVCGKGFRAVRGRNHVCSDACRIKRGTYASRMAKARIEPIDRLAVFERDGWQCYICGRACLRDLLERYHPHRAELDHVVPLSKGGAHSYDNVRCACGRCNRVKHNKSLDAARNRLGQRSDVALAPHTG